jgi:hypothetical protein
MTTNQEAIRRLPGRKQAPPRNRRLSLHTHRFADTFLPDTDTDTAGRDEPH